MTKVLLVPNDNHNYPRSDWVCWGCGRHYVVLGARGNEPCPNCEKQAERLAGLLVANDDGALLVPQEGG